MGVPSFPVKYRVTIPRLLCFVKYCLTHPPFRGKVGIIYESQVKMWTLLYSMRQKSPELDIPEGVFYDQISGYNLYVKKKDHKTGMLYDVMIYDMSAGFDNAMIILADSGKLKMTDDKEHLFLTLYSGESFENLVEGDYDCIRCQFQPNGRWYHAEPIHRKRLGGIAIFYRLDDLSGR